MANFEPLGEYFLWMLYWFIFYKEHYISSACNAITELYSSIYEPLTLHPSGWPTISSRPSTSELSFTAKPKANSQ
jgi:hypothetical protein